MGRDDGAPDGPGVHRAARITREPRDTTTMTRALVEVSVALAELRGEVRHMAAALREQCEDHERGLRSAEERLAETRDRMERHESASAQAWESSRSAIDAMALAVSNSSASLNDTLNNFTAYQREDRENLVEMLKAREAREEARAQREEERRQAEIDRVTAAQREAAAEAALAKERKDQWLQRFWATARQPLLAILMAVSGALAVWLGNCGGGGR